MKPKPQEYYTEKIYTQEQMDLRLKQLIHDPKIAVPLSGNYLSENGWEKNGFMWRKGNEVITFDGVKWLLNNSERIHHIQDLPK